MRWPVARSRAKRVPGQMNATEQRYASELQVRKNIGDIADFWFEGIKLRLANSTFYTPDFMVMLANGEIELHETKGHWEDDARVKIKVAAEQYPFRFIAAKPRPKKDGGGWKYEEF